MPMTERPFPDDASATPPDPTGAWHQRDRFCVTCKYNLRGLNMGLCPECGTPFNVHNQRTVLTSDQLAGPRPTQWPHWRRVACGATAGLLLALPYLSLVVAPFTTTACCFVFFAWPVLTGVTAWLAMEAILPEAWAGIWVNVFIACILAGLAVTGQLALLMRELHPIGIALGWSIGLPVGLLRSRKYT